MRRGYSRPCTSNSRDACQPEVRPAGSPDGMDQWAANCHADAAADAAVELRQSRQHCLAHIPDAHWDRSHHWHCCSSRSESDVLGCDCGCSRSGWGEESG